MCCYVEMGWKWVVVQLEITRDASIHLLDALMNLDVESIEL